MLNGLTPLSASDLVPLAKSWSYPPGLTLIDDGGYEDMGYDPSERAYQINVTGTLPFSGLDIMLKGDPESPVINPCMVIRNWEMIFRKSWLMEKKIQQVKHPGTVSEIQRVALI